MKHSLLTILFSGLIAWLPFLNRPLSVDDHAIFQQAIYLSHDLSQPYQAADRGMGWSKGAAPAENNPPVYLYLQALGIRFFGEAEWKAHLLQMVFNFVAAFGFFFLARRFTAHALWATLAWIFTPHFLLTANSLLVDSLLAPLLLAGLCMWVRGCESGRRGALLSGAFLLGLVPLVKYTGVLAVALAILWVVFSADRKWSRLAYLLLPLGMFAAWMLWSRGHYGDSHFSSVAKNSLTRPSIFAGLTILEFMSGTTPFLAIAVLAVAVRELKIFVAAAAIFAGLAAVGIAYGFPVGVSAAFSAWTVLSLVWWRSVAALPSRAGLNHFLLAWVAMGLGGLLVARGWFCARYVVIVGPAIVLLTVEMLAVRAPALLGSRAFRRAALAGAAGLALFLQAADYERAVVDRRTAASLNQWLAARPEIARAYYPASMLSGLGFYLDKTAAWKPAETGQVLQQGDVCIMPSRTVPPRFMPAMKEPRLMEKHEVRSWNPFRVFDFKANAGFYGSIWAPLPFSLSNEPIETFLIFEETAHDNKA